MSIAGLKFGLLLGQLLPAGVHLGLPGVHLGLGLIQLPGPLLQFGLAGLELVLGVLQLGFGLLDGHIGIVQLFLVIVDLRLGVLQLLQTVLVFPLAVPQLLQRVGQIGFAVLQLPEGVLQLPLALFIVRQAVGIFLFAVLQFPEGVVQLLLALGGLVGQFLPGVIQLLLGVFPETVGPDVLLGLCQLLYPLLNREHQVIIVPGEGLGLQAVLHRHVKVGVIVHVQHAVIHIDHAADGAVAHGGAAPLDQGDVVAAGDHAHDGEPGMGKNLLRGFVPVILVFQRQHLQRGAHVQGGLAQAGAQDHHALIVGLGPAALHQLRTVHQGGVVPFPGGDTVEAGHQRVAGIQRHLPVGAAGGHDGPDPLHPGEGLRVAVFQTQRAHHAQVIEVALVVQFADGVAHVRRGGQQPRQKAGAQRHDEKDRQKTAEAAPDGPEVRLEKRLFYHSIISTGMGSALTSLLTMRPLLTRMTRSAMAVRAVLWVMTTTVLPVWRQVSCSSLRMLLPVT